MLQIVDPYRQSSLQTMTISATSGMLANVRRLWHAMGMPQSSRYCFGMLACKQMQTYSLSAGAALRLGAGTQRNAHVTALQGKQEHCTERSHPHALAYATSQQHNADRSVCNLQSSPLARESACGQPGDLLVPEHQLPRGTTQSTKASNGDSSLSSGS